MYKQFKVDLKNSGLDEMKSLSRTIHGWIKYEYEKIKEECESCKQGWMII